METIYNKLKPFGILKSLAFMFLLLILAFTARSQSSNSPVCENVSDILLSCSGGTINTCDDIGVPGYPRYSWICTATGFTSTQKNPVIPVGNSFYHEGTYFLTVWYGPGPGQFQNGFTSVVFSDPFIPGLAGEDQTICANTTPANPLTCNTFGGGAGINNITYYWEKRVPPSPDWTTTSISGVGGFPLYLVPNYTFPVIDGPLTSTTEFRVRGVNLYCLTYPPQYSNVVTITVQPVPADAGTISGPVIVMQSQTGVAYSVPVIDGATGYAWTLAPGASIASGDNTNSITVDYSLSASSGPMSVYGTSICGNGVPSPELIITVTPFVPTDLNLADIVINPGQTTCYNALQTITVAGNGSVFTVQDGGSVTLIAGQNILLMPGTTVNNGGYLDGHITTNGSYCGSKAPAMVNSPAGPATIAAEPDRETPFFRVYPNPTPDRVTVEFMETAAAASTIVTVYNMSGNKVVQKSISGETNFQFSLSGQPVGIYILHVRSDGRSEMVKVVKND